MCQREASFSQHLQRQHVRIVQENQFLLRGRAFFYCRYKRLQEEQLLTDRKNSSQILIISEKKLAKVVLYSSNFLKKITERNQKFRTFPFRLNFVLRQNRLFRYKTLYICTQLFVHTFSQLTMTPDLLWKGPHIHISSVIFVISMMLMNVFVCPYSFVNITVIPVHFYYFIFCFKFYYPILNIIVNDLYLVFLRSRKTNTKCCDKNEKKPTVISS